MQTFKSNLKSVISLSEHEHRPTVRKSYTCKYYYTCKFVKSALASHQAVRNVNKLTQERRRPYANIVKSALVSHRIASSILHTGSKPYTCNHCKKHCFWSSSHYKEQEQPHSAAINYRNDYDALGASLVNCLE